MQPVASFALPGSAGTAAVNGVALGLLAMVAAIVLRPRRRYPSVVRVFVIVVIVLVALLAARIEAMAAIALVSAAATVAARLGRSRSREL